MVLKCCPGSRWLSRVKVAVKGPEMGKGVGCAVMSQEVRTDVISSVTEVMSQEVRTDVISDVTEVREAMSLQLGC